MRNNFKKHIKRVKKITTPLLFLSLIGTLNESSLADNIDTSSNISTRATQEWGYPNTMTYGQWFTAPEGKTSVDSFSFFIKESVAGSADLKYKGYLMKFDSVNGKVESQIFSSDQKTLDSSFHSQTNFELSIDVGGESITPGETYAIFLSAYGQGNSEESRYSWFTEISNADGLGASGSGYILSLIHI